MQLPLIAIALRLDHIANRHNTNQRPMRYHRDMPDALFGHNMGHRLQVILWDPRDPLSRHHGAHGQREEPFILGDSTHNVAFREDADWLTGIVHHNQRTDIMPNKRHNGLANRLLRPDCDHVSTLRGYDALDVHSSSPSHYLQRMWRRARSSRLE